MAETRDADFEVAPAVRLHLADLGLIALVGLVGLGSFVGYQNLDLISDTVAGFRPTSCPSASLPPFDMPSIKGLNYGTPSTADGEYVGTQWLRSGTGVADHWAEVKPALEADLNFIRDQDMGRVARIFIGLDQLMVWDPRRGFVGFRPASLDHFRETLEMFDARGMKVIVVLYDQEEVESLGNFHFEALDGAHPAMRNNYLRATEIFMRQFGSSQTVIGWDLFNEPYNSLGRDGKLPRPPAANPVSPNYSRVTVHDWLRDLYAVAKCASPSAWLTFSDTTDLYWKDRPDVSKYDDAVDFYDIHVYDDHPRLRDWKHLLHKPYLIGEAAADVSGQHYEDQRLNSAAIRFLLEHAQEAGVRAVLAQSDSYNIIPADRSGPTATGLVLKNFVQGHSAAAPRSSWPPAEAA